MKSPFMCKVGFNFFCYILKTKISNNVYKCFYKCFYKNITFIHPHQTSQWVLGLFPSKNRVYTGYTGCWDCRLWIAESALVTFLENEPVGVGTVSFREQSAHWLLLMWINTSNCIVKHLYKTFFDILKVLKPL